MDNPFGTNPFYTALLNSETKESLARMVVALRADLNRRNEAAREVRQLARGLHEKIDDFVAHWRV